MEDQTAYLPPAADVEPPDRRFPGCWMSLLLLAACWCLIVLIYGAVAAVLAVGQKLSGQPLLQLVEDARVAVLMQGVIMVAVAIVLLLVGQWLARRPLLEILPVHRSPIAMYLPLLIFGCGQAILLSEVDNILQRLLPMPAFLQGAMATLIETGWLSFIVVAIIAPLTEEAIFRGLILNGLRKRYDTRGAMLISAALFAVYHLNPYQFIGAFVIGLVLAWLRLRSGSLWPCIVLHAVNNALAVIVAIIDPDIPGLNARLAGTGFQPWWLDGIGLLATAIGLAGMVWLLPRPAAPATDAANPPAPPPPAAVT